MFAARVSLFAKLGCLQLAVLVSILPAGTILGAEPAKQEGKLAGILIDKKPNVILVKADGDNDPMRYLVDPADKKLATDFKTIFDACRVQLTYKQVGEDRHLLSIQRQLLTKLGVVTGEVVKVYNDFWVEVKPKNAVADAYAPGVTNFNDKAFMEKLKGLKKGDSVTIKFNTDFERHRIETLRINSRER